MSGNLEKIFGENIQRARKMRKLSISELASRIGVSVEKVRSLERGESPPDLELISKIAQKTNVELRFFFESDNDFEQKILLRRNFMTKREKSAVIELAKYKSGGAVSLAIVCNMPIFTPIAKGSFGLDEARELGIKMAQEWIAKGGTISEVFETHGVFIIKIPAETALFNGLFIYKRGVPVIVLSNWPKSPEKELNNISHELGHAVFLRQGLPEEEEEKLCDAFGDGFSRKISENEFSLGEFDFIENKTIFAWKTGKITASRAAEILETNTSDFLKRNGHENTL